MRCFSSLMSRIHISAAMVLATIAFLAVPENAFADNPLACAATCGSPGSDAYRACIAKCCKDNDPYNNNCCKELCDPSDVKCVEVCEGFTCFGDVVCNRNCFYDLGGCTVVDG